MYDLTGKVAVVTGVGRPRGIGRATALRLAQEGAKVVLATFQENVTWSDRLGGNSSSGSGWIAP